MFRPPNWQKAPASCMLHPDCDKLRGSVRMQGRVSLLKHMLPVTQTQAVFRVRSIHVHGWHLGSALYLAAPTSLQVSGFDIQD